MALVAGSGLLQDPEPQKARFIDGLNTTWHKMALQLFMVIVLAHWAEHLSQASQVYILGWDRPHAGGALGHLFPWLVKSEWLHYGYAIVMLAGLIVLRPGFVGLGLTWWTVALAIQLWHHFEHLLLLVQALTQRNLFGAAVPTSILQLVLPRMELHLFYNAIVFIPMVIAVYFHFHPRSGDKEATCSCRRGFVQVPTLLDGADGSLLSTRLIKR
jgi:hypothetical protein